MLLISAVPPLANTKLPSEFEPPPSKPNVPLVTSTVPVLLKAILEFPKEPSVDVPVPPDFRKVPALSILPNPLE